MSLKKGKILKIYLILLVMIFNITGCGKKGDLIQPELSAHTKIIRTTAMFF